MKAITIVEIAANSSSDDLLNALEKFKQPSPKALKTMIGVQAAAVVRRLVNGAYVLRCAQEDGVPKWSNRKRTLTIAMLRAGLTLSYNKTIVSTAAA